MYTDYKQYPDLAKLPDDLEESLDRLNESKNIKEAFGEEVINSYIKLKNLELDNFNEEESFDKRSPVTEW